MAVQQRAGLVGRDGRVDPDDMAHDLQEGQVGDGLPVGETRPFEQRCFPLRHLGLELVQEPALAQTRLAHHRDDLAVTGRRSLPGAEQRVELRLAADETGEAPLGQGFEPALPLTGGDGLVGNDRLRLALQRERANRLPTERLARRPVGRLAGQDTTGCRRRFEPGGQVDRVPQRRVLDRGAFAHAAGQDETAVHPDPHPELCAESALHVLGVAGQVLLDRQGGMDGPDGVVLFSQRRAEEGHHAVAGEGVHPAPVALHLPGEQSEAPVHQLVDDLRVEPLRQRSETDDIGKQDGDLPALALHRRWGHEAPPPPQRRATTPAEPLVGLVGEPARRALHEEWSAAFAAESPTLPVRRPGNEDNPFRPPFAQRPVGWEFGNLKRRRAVLTFCRQGDIANVTGFTGSWQLAASR